MTSGRRRLIICSTAMGSAAVLLYFMPLFHVVPLEVAGQRSVAATFDPVAFVDSFWTERLLPSADRAVDVATLVAAVREDRQAAKRAHGRSVGLGGVYYYFVAGTGRVVAVEKNSVGLAVLDGEQQVQVALETGNIFGNTLRDGTGLLDVNDIANSQDFNALSSEINGRIEREVLPSLRSMAVTGATIRFVGCAEIVDEDTDLQPLRIVPFIAETP
ncbi:MAG TPA: DUF2291 domain-containing protein [Thermoguttaceae bacterium]|nr:DUF2291 domain-containing protein [Thermoguttaceae bacterium]